MSAPSSPVDEHQKLGSTRMVEDKNESENNAGDAEDDTEWLIMDLLDDNGAQLRIHYSILRC